MQSLRPLAAALVVVAAAAPAAALPSFTQPSRALVTVSAESGAAGVNPPAFAAGTGTAARSITLDFEDPLGSGADSLSSALGAVDTAEGTLRGAASVTGGCGFSCTTNAASRATLVEILRFDATATVSYDFLVDGVFTTGGAFAEAAARVVAGVELYSIAPPAAPFYDAATNIFLADAPLLPGSASVTAARGATAFGFATDGALAPGELVELAVQGSFDVVAGVEYALVLSQFVAVFQRTFAADAFTGADFSNTATFRFTDLGGATFESGSGLFLSAASAEVPVPAAGGLLAAGLGALALARRRRRG